MSKSRKDALGELARKPGGGYLIRFSDAAYVRSDIIIFDRRDSSLHAVLHESAHFIGYADRALAGGIRDNLNITLAAPFHKGTLKLSTRISVA